MQRVDHLNALEAVSRVSRRLGIPTARLKPCICSLLEGDLVGSRQSSAFAIAVELRSLGFEQKDVAATLTDWALQVGWNPRRTTSAVNSAFRKKPGGDYVYPPPGLTKKGAKYAEALKPICDEVGCPANCPAFSGKFSGPVEETFDKFDRLGWRRHLRKRRHLTAIDVYEFICNREKLHRLAPGAPIFVSFAQIASDVGAHKSTIGPALRFLDAVGLIEVVIGSGSGPHAKDRKATEIRRVVPIPSVPGAAGDGSMGAITTGRTSRPHMGRIARRLTNKTPPGELLHGPLLGDVWVADPRKAAT